LTIVNRDKNTTRTFISFRIPASHSYGIMKILLVQPPHYFDGGGRVPENFPLGLGYIARILLDKGHKVESLDIWAHQYKNNEVLDQIRAIDCDTVGISALSTQYAYVKWLLKELRQRTDAPIVVGNALATLSPELVLNNTEADVCVLGEGEETFTEVVENMSRLESVQGIAYKEDRRILKTPRREHIRDLDTVGFPAWDTFPVEVYLKNCQVEGTKPALNLISGRGCPYRCAFCSKTLSGTRQRSVDNIIEEIKTLIDKYHIRAVFFNDELVVTSKKRAYELCEKIEPLKLKWICNGRTNLVDLPLLKRMRKAGCQVIGLGVESGSQAILDNMNKQVALQQSKMALTNTMKAGLRPVVFMMYGYLGENKKTVAETVKFFRELPYIGTHIVPFAITTPLPGTPLYDMCIEKGLIRNEEEYLEGLSSGYSDYQREMKRSFVNLTEFSDEEFFRFKHTMEEQIVGDQIRGHPLQYLFNRQWLSIVLKETIGNHGYLKGTMRLSRAFLGRLLRLWGALNAKQQFV